MPLHADRIDHLVLTVADIERSVEFYARNLGMRRIEFGEGRVALGFGTQKINLHQAGSEFSPRAGRAQPGSADLCLVIDDAVEQAPEVLRQSGVEVIEGPVARTGATGEIVSVYFRDPDKNLIEVCNYVRD
jgi:catechol 2,3-dioxygenase-like lactoylglutathione lyase family enzyme